MVDDEILDLFRSINEKLDHIQLLLGTNDDVVPASGKEPWRSAQLPGSRLASTATA